MTDYSEQCDALYPFPSSRAQHADTQKATLFDTLRYRQSYGNAVFRSGHGVQSARVACDYIPGNPEHTPLADHRGRSGAAS